MLGGFAALFDRSAFIPHGICLAWQPELLALHVSSDALIGLSYYSIPLALVYFVHRRRDVAFSWVFWLFAAFILACGTTHFANIWTLWTPDYGLEALIKLATALVSMLTAMALWILMPKALALPSPRQLAEANVALQHEIVVRRQAEERYSGFFNNLAEALFIVTVRPDGQFAFDAVNPAHARATGLDPAFLCGRTVTEALPRAAAVLITSHFTACIEQGRPVDFEDAMELPVGQRIWHVVLVPVFDAGGRVVQILGSARDITERRRLQEELIQTSKLATLGTLAAGMAHEMSQPLNVIRMWAENSLSRLLRNELDPERLTKVLTIVAEQTERMGRIIDHIRSFSRRDSAGGVLFDPAEGVAFAAEMVRHQYQLEDIAVEVGGTGEGCAVNGHRLQFEQVIVNLLANARDAITDRRTAGVPAAGLIRIAVEPAAAGRSVHIVVTDNGGGIPPHILPRIFDPFFTTKEVGSGTGLGLSIGYGIINAMQGRIEAEVVEHGDGLRGTRFTITLPVAAPTIEEGGRSHG